MSKIVVVLSHSLIYKKIIVLICYEDRPSITNNAHFGCSAYHYWDCPHEVLSNVQQEVTSSSTVNGSLWDHSHNHSYCTIPIAISQLANSWRLWHHSHLVGSGYQHSLIGCNTASEARKRVAMAWQFKDLLSSSLKLQYKIVYKPWESLSCTIGWTQYRLLLLA